MNAPDREFTTSGHSGDPVTWVRTAEQLHAEVDLITGTLLGPVDQVVTFAPSTNLYGYLFGDLLPRRRGLTVQDLSGDPLTVPHVPAGVRTLFVCLPSSWPVMRMVATGDSDLTGSFALHSTGPTTPATARAMPALAARGLRAVELFGSTETGGIAHRDIPPDGQPQRPWQLLPDVAIVHGEPDAHGTCLLHVRGPRIARQRGSDVPEPTHRLTDVVRLIGEREFHFIGRSSRLVKINGRRCHLGVVEDAISSARPDLEVVCLAVRDQVRGEHYEVFYAGQVSDLTGLAGILGDLPLPRGVYRVPRIPRTATGKVQMDRLYALAAAPAGSR